MVFREEEIPTFIQIFNTSCSKIRSSEGCIDLKLLQSTDDKRIFFTLSLWESEKYLQDYRSSELFGTTWAKTKILFADKPEAWTTITPL